MLYWLFMLWGVWLGLVLGYLVGELVVVYVVGVLCLLDVVMLVVVCGWLM